MFASKTPRDLNRDPYPWVHPNGGRIPRRYGLPENDTYDPRPEFDHVQHNPPSEVLQLLRRATAGGYQDAFITAFLSTPGRPDAAPVVKHARRVITRLAALRGAL